MTDRAGIVVVGGGQAACQLAASLRESGFAEPITLVAAENCLPYQRPPLSKSFLKDASATRASLYLRAEAFYESQAIQLRLGDRVATIEAVDRRAILQNGASIAYDHLVLATGSRNRTLDVPGTELSGIFYLRTVEEAEAIRERLDSVSAVAVIGGGFVGLELACVMKDLGKEVSVIESLPRPLVRSLSYHTSEFLAAAHRLSGIRLMTSEKVAGFIGRSGSVTGVEMADGRVVTADLVLVGVGAIAETGLADDCGLNTDNGIVVDAFLRSSNSTISAIGDCALVRHDGRPGLRLESVQNAVDQARCLAAGIAGAPRPYAEIPWFWSDQGKYRLQIAGLPIGADEYVVRGKMSSGRFSVFCFLRNRLIGVESVNQSADHMIARRLLKSELPLSSREASDLDFDLKGLALRGVRDAQAVDVS